MAKTINSINNKTGELTIDPGSSGDSGLQFSLSGTGKFKIGVDDSDSDIFKISSGSALGTTDTLVMRSTGEITLPLTSSFCAYAAFQTNVTGDSTKYKILFTDEKYDLNNDFASSTFTAPVSGRYLFLGSIRLDDVSSSYNYSELELQTTNVTYLLEALNPYRCAASDDLTFNICVITELDVGDTAIVNVTVDGGSKYIDIFADSSNLYTVLSGSLIS